MKVALIHMRYGFKGGLETRMHNYVHWFCEQGHQVTVLAHKIASETEVPKGVTIERMDIDNVPKPLRLLAFNRRVANYMAHHSFDLSLSMGRTYSQKLLIAPNTHKGYLNALDRLPYFPKDWVELYLDHRSFRASSHILACSEMVRQEVIKLYDIPESKVVTLPPPVNTQRFNPKPPANKLDLREKYGLSPDKKVLLFVSTSHRRKGLSLLQDLFHLLPKDKYELALAGVDPQHEFGLPNLKPLGFVHKMEELYHAADYTIHPAIYEPFGQVVSESLACGTPVIISDTTGAKQIVDASCGRVVKGFDPGQWKKVMDKVAETDLTVPEDIIQQHQLALNDHLTAIIKLNASG